MTHTTLGRTIHRTATLAIPLLVAVTGTAAAHGGGGYGMMGSGGMGFWGLLWMGVLIAVPLYLTYSLLDDDTGRDDSGPLSVLRERYAGGELSDEEFDRRREKLDRTE